MSNILYDMIQPDDTYENENFK